MFTLIQIESTLRARIDNRLRRKAFRFSDWDNEKISSIARESLIDTSDLCMDDLVNSDKEQRSRQCHSRQRNIRRQTIAKEREEESIKIFSLVST